jgi:hypothetical protein
VFSSVADAILVSGPITGPPADQSDLRKVREAITSVPVFANTGVSIDNVAEVLSLADGAIIGTHFKIDGNTWNASTSIVCGALCTSRGPAPIGRNPGGAKPHASSASISARLQSSAP